MGENSKIEWTDHTFNPWIGYTKVAEGCKHCYAEALAKRTAGAQWGPGGTRVFTSAAYWTKPFKWDREAKAAGVRAKVFCASMADVFEDWLGPVLTNAGETLHKCVCGHIDVIDPADGFWEKGESESGVELFDCPRCGKRGELKLASMGDLRQRLFDLIDKTPNLDWLLLTKRPENILGMWPKYELGRWDSAGRELPTQHRRKNVWLGTSVACQDDANRNVPYLLKCRELSPVLFLSMEPLVEVVTLSRVCYGPSIDWVIVGGESGPQARPMPAEAVTQLRKECIKGGIPFFFKQWGGKDKKATGRELDGKTYSEFPEAIKRAMEAV